jgi:hypothetical protein
VDRGSYSTMFVITIEAFMAGITPVILLWFLTCMQLSLPGPNSVTPDDKGITFL